MDNLQIISFHQMLANIADQKGQYEKSRGERFEAPSTLFEPLAAFLCSPFLLGRSQLSRTR